MFLFQMYIMMVGLYDEKSTNESDEESCHDLREGVLSQNHAGRPHHAGKENHEREPPYRIERKCYRIGDDSPCHPSYGGRVGRNLPPHIDEGTSHLYHERCYQDDADDSWGVVVFHQEETSEIAQDGDDVGNDASLFSSQFLRCPTL